MCLLPHEVLFPGEVRHVATDEAFRSWVASQADGQQPVVAIFSRARLAPGAVGVQARVLEACDGPAGCSLRIQALRRIRLEGLAREAPHLCARTSEALELPGLDARLDARVRELARELIQRLPELGDVGDASALLESARTPGTLADLIGAHLGTLEEQVELLETLDVDRRLELAERVLSRKLADLRPAVASELRALWPFEPGAEQRLLHARKTRSMSADEAARVADFVQRGFVVWNGLIEPELVDELVADVRRIREHPGYFLTTDHRNARPFRYSGADFDSYESIFDAYVNLESARRVCLHPALLRFLELLFAARPVAFQQLLFQRSNGHLLHQDTAYVCVEEPLWMVATWIALEDVVPGRGELTYFEGSHRIPHHLFADGSKRFMAGRDDELAMRRHIEQQCRRLGCVKRDFFAKKGDVLLWAADLVHGSNPRTRPEHETRMACVTHYCPETTRPFWFRAHERLRGLERHGERARIASSVYRLPKEAALVRPTFRIPEPDRLAS